MLPPRTSNRKLNSDPNVDFFMYEMKHKHYNLILMPSYLNAIPPPVTLIDIPQASTWNIETNQSDIFMFHLVLDFLL